MFIDLPAGAVAGSIRVEGKATGKLEIGSVDTRRTFLPRADAAGGRCRAQEIEDDIRSLAGPESGARGAECGAAETQKALIANLAQLPTRPAPAAGRQPRPKTGSAFSRTIAQGSMDASRGSLEAQVKARELERKIEDLEKQARPHSRPPRRADRGQGLRRGRLAARSRSDHPLPGGGRRWTPLYDARLQTGTKTAPPKLELVAPRRDHAETGETWDNAALQLSTARPSAGASAPDSVPQTVDFEPEDGRCRCRCQSTPRSTAQEAAAPEAAAMSAS